MSIQEKFEKAVNVIRNLPKNGTYQPSHELQLRFYAYFKQATEGYNYHPRPSFWEVVRRAKWDAWAKLGNMTKEEAMRHYVDELRKIVETMSYTDNVASFLSSMDDFYENVPAEDLELLVGPIIEKIRSRPNSPLSGSPLASRDTSPARPNGISREASVSAHKTKHLTSSVETSPTSSYSASPLPPDTDDEDNDHFLDTQTEPEGRLKESSKKLRTEGTTEDHGRTDQLRPFIANSHQGKNVKHELPNKEVTLQVPETAISEIRKDMDQIKSLLNCVESSVFVKSKQMNGLSKPETGNQTEPNHNSSHRSETSAAVSDAFKRAIEDMTKEMENLQQRMTALENRRLDIPPNRKRGGGTMVPKWWGLPLRTTVVLLAWPVVILIITKWISKRRRG